MQFFTKNTFLLVALAASLFSCEVVEDIIPNQETEGLEETNYIIKAGSHETTNPLVLLKASKIKFSVKFDKTAEYTTKDPNNQADINKLYGMADCGTFHQVNSARFGWRWYQGKLELLAYSYLNGVNSSTLITSISPGQWYTCELTLENGKYVYQVGDKKVEHQRNCTGEGNGYQLYPYFGGDETAPHEISILIKNEK